MVFPLLSTSWLLLNGGTSQVIPTLQQCGALSMLKLHRSTADGSTERVQSYHTKVFDCMPRIKVLDGLTNPETLSQTQISAATFLNHIARVPANQLDHVNLTARNITQDEFFWVLAALGNLPVRKLALKSEFAVGVALFRPPLICLRLQTTPCVMYRSMKQAMATAITPLPCARMCWKSLMASKSQMRSGAPPAGWYAMCAIPRCVGHVMRVTQWP